jgi:ADP-heptose:LPS heptosyltransferase
MKYKKALILNLIPNTIGDNIFLTPLISILKDNCSIVDLTVSCANADIFHANPNILTLYEIPELKIISDRKKSRIYKAKTYLSMIRKYSKLFRDKGYDICLVMMPNFPLNVLIPRLAGIKEIAGYSYNGAFLSFFLTKKAKYHGLDTKDYEYHFLDTYLDILRAIGLKWDKSEEKCRLYLTGNEEKKYLKILDE